MSKFVADKCSRMTDEDGNIILTFTVSSLSRESARMTAEEVKGKQVVVDVKEYKSKRSVEQNKMLWALLGKMAEAMSGYGRRSDVMDCYCAMLEQTNAQCDYLLTVPEAEQRLKETYRVVRKIGVRQVNGKLLNMYQVFVGSSKYTTEEMSKLIEATLDRLAEMGITDSEIELARQEYKTEKRTKQ